MLNRLLLAGLVFYAMGARAFADSLDAQLFPLSGEIRFRNPSGAAVPFVYYSVTSISSTSGALNPSIPQWQSISDFYDASGNGFIDPTYNWAKLSATSIELTEGLFAGPGTFGSLPAHRSVTLGPIWNPNVVDWDDLAFDVQQQTQPVTVNVILAVEGDYDNSGTVNQADYTVWRQNFGSTTLLDADGNIDGIVDAADYAIWSKNFGNSLPAAGSGSQFDGGQSFLEFGGSVPEPAAGSLILIAMAAIISQLRARRAA